MKQQLIISFIAIAQLLSAGIRTYDYPKEVKLSGRFKLKVDGTPVLVMDNPIPCSFAAFEMQPNESVTVEIENAIDVKWVDIRPLSAGIKPVFKNNKITFTIPKAGNYSIEINGKLDHPLFIFANPPEKKPAKNDPDVIYFEAGKIHTPGIIRPKSGQHIFIEGGAIVVGAIAAKNVENVRISGHGILDGSLNNGLSNAETASMFSIGNGYKSTGKYQRFIEFFDSKNITIEGLILNNSTTWQIVPINCDRVKISRLKLISDNPSDDGIDIVRSRDVHVTDCFVRVKDDCVAIKAHLDYPDNAIVDNVLIENCVFWNAAWGNGLEIGFELHASEVKNITFRNCDVIHVESGAVFSIHNSDKATVSNVLFENIRVEDARHKLFDLAIFRSRYCTDGSSDQEYIAANYFHGAWDGVLKVPEDKKDYHAQFRGQIEDIQFKNIYIYGIVPFSILSGFDEKHLVKNVTFDNIVLNGRKANDMEELKLYTEYAERITLNSGQIAVNQLGFYPEAPKEAAVIADSGIKTFKIVDAATGKEVYSGELNESLRSKNSSLSVRRADFSAYTTPGDYRIVAGKTNSAVFAIRNHVLSDVAKAALKAFYYQRVSEPLDSRYAGRWARPAGHPDTVVYIHPSAATPQRPEGTVIRSPGGWYDAGDYNKYIVNSGITTATLLSAYEDFPDYYRQLAVGIPETGNGIPDILSEILCNLRWMLTMQDPNDGGVYHKCTNASFDGMVMPGVTKEPRYAVRKSTAATLDFTAVMAQASRVYAGYGKQLPGLADSCLHAARKAWEWALLHPDLTYNQDALNRQYKPAVSTGAYGDNRLDDEWFWAAAEMYAVTSDPNCKAKAVKYMDARLQVPSWGQVYMLGVYTLLRIREPELAAGYRKKVLMLADNFVTSVRTNAFGVVMGHEPSDFVWGSNAVAANQGILLIQAYLLTQDAKYLDAALTNADYLLGKNATGYCFVTGFGSKRVMNPHHRPSVADGIDDPVPGMLAGGTNPGMQDGCEYPFTEPETAFVDHADSYASNEIAINWNAPAVYLFNALEALQNRRR